MQRRAVVGPHGRAPARHQGEEGLVGIGVRAQPGATDRVALDGQPQAEAERGQADGATEDAAPHPTVRGTRAPIRVTTS